MSTATLTAPTIDTAALTAAAEHIRTVAGALPELAAVRSLDIEIQAGADRIKAIDADIAENTSRLQRLAPHHCTSSADEIATARRTCAKKAEELTAHRAELARVMDGLEQRRATAVRLAGSAVSTTVQIMLNAAYGEMSIAYSRSAPPTASRAAHDTTLLAATNALQPQIVGEVMEPALTRRWPAEE